MRLIKYCDFSLKFRREFLTEARGVRRWGLKCKGAFAWRAWGGMEGEFFMEAGLKREGVTQGLEMNVKLRGGACTKGKAKPGLSLRLVDRKFLELLYQPLIIPLTMMIDQVL